MTFYWFLPLKLVIFALLAYSAALPFINQYKREEDFHVTKKWPYVYIVVLVVLFIITPFKLTSYEASGSVIRSFDAPVQTELPEIRTHERGKYEAPSNIEEYNQTIKTGE